MLAMRQSELFTKTRRAAPKDEVARNAQLLIRAGYIHKEMAGAYSLLPLGLRVVKKIEQIIREEMNAIGGQEMEMTALQSPHMWQKSGRWDDDVIDVWFKTRLKPARPDARLNDVVGQDSGRSGGDGGELGLATTHEEPMTAIMKEFIQSYKDLPRYPYQFQKKFRNELRAKSGILRTREFVMKDLYSFNRSEEEFREFYEQAASAYLKIFARAGLGDVVFRTFASGGSFSKFSDEFQVVCDAGEDIIHLHRGKKIAVNKEVYQDDILADLGIDKGELEEVKAIEVGNIFPLGTRFSEVLGLTFKDESGEAKHPIMGSYGIGPARLMGTIVEVLSDKKGIIWPQEVAPFRVHLLAITGGNADVEKEADRIFELMHENDIEVLYDDRDLRAGEKFVDADLIGIPVRLVVSEKTMQEGGIEMVARKDGTTSLIPDSAVIERLKK